MTDEIKHVKTSDLQPDANNANRGTQRGQAMLESSLRKYGAGRSILLDKAGRVIAGNKTLQQAVDIGLDDVIIVKTDGRQLVAVQREDLDLADDDNDARALAYADNRIGQVDLDFDPAVILADINAGVDLGQWWSEDEISKVLEELYGSREGTDAANDPNAEWEGMPEFEQEDKTAFRSLHVHFKDQAAVDAFAELVGQKITDRTRFLWYPEIEIETYADKRYVSES